MPPLVLPLLPTAVALLRRACSWSNSKSSRRCVKASFCWMAIRNREFRVFFSSSAAASCLCMSSNWVTYSSHLRQKRGEKSRRERGGAHYFQQVEQFALKCNCCGDMFSPFPRQRFPDGRMRSLRMTSDCSQNALCLFHKCIQTRTQNSFSE